MITLKEQIKRNYELSKKLSKEYNKIYGLFVVTVAILVASQFYLGNTILFTTRIYFVVIFIAALFLIKKLLEPKVE